VLLRVHTEKPVWYWTISVRNTGRAARCVDLLYGQDLGLAGAGALRSNEAYTSHYIDHRVEQDPALGPVVLSRQNQPQNGAFPWTMQGCLTGADSFATDGFQFFGLDHKISGEPEACRQSELLSKKLQYEFAYAALQARAFDLAPGGSRDVEFFALFNPNHAAASGPADLRDIGEVKRLRIGLTRGQPVVASPAPVTLFQAPLLQTVDLTDGEIAEFFGRDQRCVEREDGRLLPSSTDRTRTWC